LQIEFSRVIQARTDASGGEVTPAEMWAAFRDEYLPNPDARWGRFALRSLAQASAVDAVDSLSVVVRDWTRPAGDEDVTLDGSGNGPIAAFCDALSTYGVDVRVLDYHEHALSAGGDAKAAAYLECAVGDTVLWGVGVDPNIVTASLKAVVSAVNRALR
jgi:2-isopropylmalate synthase